jgi:hypothetical protein
MKTATIVLLAILLPLAAVAGPPAAEPDPAETFLRGVGASFAAGSADGIARHFPAEGKVELRLKRMTGGKYRGPQARSLLAAWLKEIESKEWKLKQVRVGAGEFESKYKVRADGSEVASTTLVYFEKEGETWRITGIVES